MLGEHNTASGRELSSVSPLTLLRRHVKLWSLLKVRMLPKFNGVDRTFQMGQNEEENYENLRNIKTN